MAICQNLALQSPEQQSLDMGEANNSEFRWRRLKGIFDEAVELSPANRSRYLSALRLNENSLYGELSELIEIEAEAENFLNDPINLKPIDFSSVSLIDETVGHYKIVREIERGGMGTVFEAIRSDDEFNQRVAVKLINHNFVNAELLERFKRERQILATLEHPHIVRLLDGGLTADKTPYYVMEYIEGISINKYSRANILDINRKLKLFLQVCEAVSYAHRQLIVHRDLKPSNILVTETEQVKLLDFGIAKILDSHSEAQTQTQNAPLTPAYSSPEQIRGESITTVSDVFSLGSVLYELLTGKSPHEFYGVSHSEVARGICELEPIRPSTITLKSKTDDNAANLPQASSTFGGQELKGDLDNIIIKALRKEKEERYGSVEQFAEDIEFYLNGLPVKAHPQSFKYRASKFIKRNRWTVGLTVAALFLIAGGAVAAIWQSIVANRQKQIAEQQKQIAERRFDQVRKIANSLIFDYHDEIAKLEGSTKLREKLVVDAVNYLNAISEENTDNPELLKEISLAYRKIGDVQGMPYDANLGKSDEAIKNYQNSISLLQKATALNPSDDSLKDELILSYKSLAYVEIRADNKEQARLDLSQALRICEALISSDENNLERKIIYFKLLLTLGGMQENFLSSLESYQKALDGLNDLYAAHPNNPQIINVLAGLHQRIGTTSRWIGEDEEEKNNLSAAKEFYTRAVEHGYQTLKYDAFAAIARSKATNERQSVDCYTNLASSLNDAGQANEAMKKLQIAESIIRNLRTGDPDNQELVLDEIAVYNVKRKMFVRQGKLNEALKITNDMVKIAESAYEADSKNVEAINWVGYLSQATANLLSKQNRQREAAAYQNIFNDYARRYHEKFGKDWSGKFFF